MISSETIANEIFKIIKGNGNAVKLFTDEGKSTIDPEEARRFYLPGMLAMINLDETDSKREIKVSVSSGSQLEELNDTLYQIKKLANKSIIEYTLKTHNKKITPKDFSYQAKKEASMNTVSEAISPAFGSSKSSYQKLEDAKLIIKHSRSVNEDQRGSRSRNIQAIYIENADGERYKLPSNNLAGGRAMLRHVKEGGTPYDDFGKYIIEKCEELKKLKEFKKYSEHNGLVNEGTQSIIEAVSNRIVSLREQLNKLKGSKTYFKMKEEFSVTEITEDNFDDVREKFTIHRFDEQLEGALPYVQMLIKEMNLVAEADSYAIETLNNLVNDLKSRDIVKLKPDIDMASDPENPLVNDVVKGAPIQAQLGAIFEYLSGVVDGSKDQDQLSVLLARMNDLIDNITDKSQINRAMAVIKEFFQKSKIKKSESFSKDLSDNKIEESLKKVISTYDFENLFS